MITVDRTSGCLEKRMSLTEIMTNVCAHPHLISHVTAFFNFTINVLQTFLI